MQRHIQQSKVSGEFTKGLSTVVGVIQSWTLTLFLLLFNVFGQIINWCPFNSPNFNSPNSNYRLGLGLGIGLGIGLGLGIGFGELKFGELKRNQSILQRLTWLWCEGVNKRKSATFVSPMTLAYTSRNKKKDQLPQRKHTVLCRGRIGWTSSKLITQIISLGSSLFGATTSAI